MTATEKFEELAIRAASLINVQVLGMNPPSPGRNGSIKVTSKEDAITLSAALSASGIDSFPASHRTSHAVYF